MRTPTMSAGRPARGGCAPAARRQGLAATARHVAVELTPQAIEQVAGRVAQLLRHDLMRTEANPAPQAGWMTAKELASHLHLNPAWVYEHADELGAIRTSDGPKARIRFDLHTATEALKRHQRQTAPAAHALKPRQPISGPYRTDAPLLEIRRREIRRGRSCFALRHERMASI
jgi:hypothetical protein